MEWPKAIFLCVIVAGGVVAGILDKWEVVSGCVAVGVLGFLFIDG